MPRKVQTATSRAHGAPCRPTPAPTNTRPRDADQSLDVRGTQVDQTHTAERRDQAMLNVALLLRSVVGRRWRFPASHCVRYSSTVSRLGMRSRPRCRRLGEGLRRIATSPETALRRLDPTARGATPEIELVVPSRYGTCAANLLLRRRHAGLSEDLLAARVQMIRDGGKEPVFRPACDRR